jgi:hypothetical protein
MHENEALPGTAGACPERSRRVPPAVWQDLNWILNSVKICTDASAPAIWLMSREIGGRDARAPREAASQAA